MTRRLYLLDVRHFVERRLLLTELQRADPASDAAGAPDWVAMPVTGRGGSRTLSRLAARLDGPDATEVVPLRVAWRIPHFKRERGLRLRDLALGDPRLPGRLRAALILMREHGRGQCLRGAPATLGELRDRYTAQVAASEPPDHLAFAAFVARQAALALDSEERSIQGSRYKVPRFAAESIESSPGFAADVARLAADAARPHDHVRAEARGYLREMVSMPSALFLDLRHQLDCRLWLRGYDREVLHDPQEFERLRETMRANPTLVLFTHKAYGDAALPGVMFHRCDLPMLHTFGGINLDFPVFGTLMRRSGGIFIRRSFRANPVYKMALRHYVAFLLGERFAMSWALEGTRSRLGKLMPPRYGLLKYVLDAAHEAGIADLRVVPFVTSFEQIRDVEEYVAEQTGRAKKPESLSWLLGYARSVRRPLGRVRIDLGEPVVVGTAPRPGDRLGLAKIAFETAVQANRVTPLTVTGVICLVLLGMAPRGATAPELVKLASVVADWARARGIRLVEELADADPAAFLARLDALAASGLLIRYGGGSTIVYAIDPSRHPVASYYRNSVAHHFLDKAILELALSKAAGTAGDALEPALWAETDRLRELFKFEFFYPPREQYRAGLEAELGRTDPQWQQRLRGGRQGSERLMRRLQPFIAHAVLLPYVEAYAVVLDLLARLGEGERLDAQHCVILALREGRQAYLLRRISSEASIGRILFENGYRLAENLGLAGAGTAEVIGKRRALLQELQSLARRMERLRLEALARAEEVMTMQQATR